MKYFIIAILLTACSTIDHDLEAHLEAERDFAYHQHHVYQSFYQKYDSTMWEDCYYWDDELFCEN